MAADFRQFDEHGFPIPPRYSDVVYQEDQPARPSKASLRAKRLVILGLLLGVVLPVVFGPRLLSMGRDILAQWLFSRAQQRLMEGDNAGALADLDRAIDWDPTNWQYYLQRAHLREQLADLAGSLDDLTKSIAALEAQGGFRLVRHRASDISELLAESYARRSIINVRLKRDREAIDDATSALRYNRSPQFYNNRAYVRALLGTELSEGLKDIELALADGNGGNSRERANFLDTRGYLLHLLDRNDEALKDLDQAIRITQRQERFFLAHSQDFGVRATEQLSKEFRESLAVIYHHRGLVHAKLGHEQQSATDLRQGDELGYDPERGVF